MGIFGSKPKPAYVPPPPYAPTQAQTVKPLDTADIGASSLVSTTPTGLSRKADTRKRSLIGG
jgi:hypothetical protein